MTKPTLFNRPHLARSLLAVVLLTVVLLSGNAAAEPFRKVPDSGVLLKVVAASEGVVATAGPGTAAAAFELELLRPYFVTDERSGHYLIAKSQAARSRRGWVEKARVRPWNTREGLDLDATVFLADDRPWLAAWHDRAGLEAYARTGDKDRHGPSYRARLDRSSLPEKLRPYPLLDQGRVETLTGDEKTIYHVLIPAQLDSGKVTTSLSPAEIEEVLAAVSFCIVFDATASMEEYAREMAATITRLLEQIPKEARRVRAGLVLFRDRFDDQPLLIMEPGPLGDAATVLAKNAGKMAGGGDGAEPVLDAALLAITEYPWKRARSSEKRILVLVANEDAKPETVGLAKSVEPGLDAAQVADRLVRKGVTVFALQAGPADGGNLRSTLSTLAVRTGGEHYPYSGDAASYDRGFASHIKGLIHDTVLRSAAEARRVAAAAVTSGERSVVPLHVLDPRLRARLERAGATVIAGGSTLVVEPAWMFERKDLHLKKILIDKRTVEWLVLVFNLLADSALDVTALRHGVRELVQAFLGERIEAGTELQELVEKRLGLHFRTNLLGMSLEGFGAMPATERRLLQKRIETAGTRLSRFLETATPRFERSASIWMPVSILP
ncbi:MAG: VWA domain-containing protein [bacterium]|nr:VWA domain-containing protein [bacterium]